MTSQDEPNHGDSESRQHASPREEKHASEGAFTLTDLVAAIHAMGETQREMAYLIKELKSSPSFVTDEDVIDMLEKKLSQSQEDWKYVPQPPYPLSLLQQPYPNGYKTPSFVLFDGRNGSPKEHVNRFIDALGPHASDHNLCLREFSKSLTDRAYTWYTTLAPGSVCNWEDLASKFRDLALDCYDENDEEALVEICISNIVADCRVYFENIAISQFSRLLEAVRKISMSVKLTVQRAWKSEEEKRHLGALFGQQDYQKATAVTSHKSRKSISD
ncbi:unnamed protein product [Prunus brigantina]